MPEELDLSKLFQSASELLEPEEAIIEGDLPKWINGTFLRVGPGLFDLDKNFSMNHWLDGYCIICKWQITEGKIYFTKRFLKSDAYTKAIQAKRPILSEFGTKSYPDKNKNFLSRFVFSFFPVELTDNCCANLFMINNDLLATSDTCFFRKLNPENLETGEKFDTNKYFGVNGACAHPLKDLEGNTYTIGYTCLTGMKYNVIKIPHIEDSCSNSKEVLKKSEIIFTIPSRWTSGFSYFHSFGLSSEYIVFIEQPLVVSLGKIVSSTFQGTSCKNWMHWQGPKEKCRFVVINLKTRASFEYYSEPFFFLHIINCYSTEDNKMLVIDLIAYSSPAVFETMYLSKLRNNIFEDSDPSSAVRFIIPLNFDDNTTSQVQVQENVSDYSTGTVADYSSLTQEISISNSKDLNDNDNDNQKQMTLNLKDCKIDKGQPSASKVGNRVLLKKYIKSQSGLDFPQINRKFQAKPYKYFYSAGNSNKDSFPNAIVKVNIQSTQACVWKESSNYYPTEPLFLPHISSTSTSNSIGSDINDCDEDNGIIISAVTSSKMGEKDFLLFLDAKSMNVVAKAHFVNLIPQGLHGHWIPSQKQSSN